MISPLATLLVAVGMFFVGWFAHALLAKPRYLPAPLPELGRWRCPTCERIKELPKELAGKVLVCNNCQARLVQLD